MKLKTKELNIPAANLVERIMGFYPDYDLSSCNLHRMILNPGKREITFVFDADVDEPIKVFLNSRFSRIASAELRTCVKMAFTEKKAVVEKPSDIPLTANGSENFDPDELLKWTNGATSYLKNSEISFDGSVLRIVVKSEFESQRLISKKNDINKAILKTMGRNFPLKIEIDSSIKLPEPSLEILEPLKQVETTKKETKKPSVSKGGNEKILLGKRIRAIPRKISDLTGNEENVIVAGRVFNTDCKNGKFCILTFNITDNTDTITCKAIGNDARTLSDKISDGDELIVRGKAEYDSWVKEEVIMLREVNQIVLPSRKDEEPVKRVELHLHTKMSALDSVVEIKELFKTLKNWGHDAVALTDHGVVQSIPEFYFTAKKAGINPIFGMEGYMINDSEPIVRNLEDAELKLDEAVYVVFDLETTGLKAKEDEIIEIGAVKMKGTKILETFSQLVKPKREVTQLISNLTGIDNGILNDKPPIEDVLPEFLDFCQDSILVAHNATFDYGFIRTAIKDLYDKDWVYPYIDTLALSKSLLKSKRYSLDNVVKRLKLGKFEHHRADEDARVTAEVFKRFIEMANKRGIENVLGFEKLRNSVNLSSLRPTHISLLAKDPVGLKNLYKLVTLSHTKYFHMKPRIPKSLLNEHRKGLLVGSACIGGEFAKAYLAGSNRSELEELAKFFDYIEIMPLDVMGEGDEDSNVSQETLRQMYKEFYGIGKKLNIPVVMTGDVHFLEPEDAIYRATINAAQDYSNFQNQPKIYLRTTEEMLKAAMDIFDDENIAREVVIENTRLIADQIKEIIPVTGKLNPPIIEGAEDEVRKLTYDNAIEIYGDPLPEIITARLEKELSSIIGNGYSVLYLIAQKMVKKSNDDGYVVGSRGSVGSSLVATMMGITEVNPLAPHYVCPKCKYSEFIDDPKIESGYDMKDKKCPKCGSDFNKNGQRIPFETFLGFKGDKVPDIDLNFSGEYQDKAHDYLSDLFGRDHVFRAGTIGTLADRTGFGFVKAYMEKSGKTLRKAEQERIVSGIVGVRRTTGQHPGGLVIVPKDKDVHDFAPVQYPANDMSASRMTTHFAYEYIHDDLIKMDALGHDDPTFIRMLKDITGIDPQNVPMDDEKTLSIFSSTKALGIKPVELGTELGTLGIPEFGTQFVRGMLHDTRPSTFGELVRISGLSHGTDVWLNNAKDWIGNKKATLSQVIACRDDIMNYLISLGMEPSIAFKIMEKVRKGKGLTPEDEEVMKAVKVPEWFLESCRRIKYLFPKAHAVAYVSMGFRVAYFKVHNPLAFYASYFTIRGEEFDVDIVSNGINAVRNEIHRLKGEQIKNVKDKSRETVLELVLEMLLRGYSFLPVDLNKSNPTRFFIEENSLRIPFNRLQNLGTKAAKSIENERKIRPFSSVEDLIRRTTLNKTNIEILRKYGALKGLPEKEQITLF